MGEKVNGTATDTAGGGGNPNPTGTGTERAGTGTGTGTSANTGTGTKTEEVKSSQVSGLSDIEKEKLLKEKDNNGTITDSEKLELRRLRKNRIKREKYQKEKDERDKAGITQGEPIKVLKSSEPSDPLETIPQPKKKRRSVSKKQNFAIEAEQMDALLMAVFNLLGSRPNMGHWKITKTEAHSISVPLCEILAKYDQLTALSQNSSEIALVIACMTIILPRIMLTAKINSEVKKDGLSGKSSLGSTGRKLDESRKAKNSDRSGNGKPSTTSKVNGFSNDVFGLPL